MGMFNAEMWWGMTGWSWPASRIGGRWNHVRGGVEFTGFSTGQSRNESCGVFSCSNVNREIRILAQFFLNRSRMPSGGRTFLSAPQVFFSGTVRGGTGGTLTVFDDPLAICDLELRHVVLRGGTVIALSNHSERLVQTAESTHSSDSHIMRERIPLPPLTFDLDRRFNLEIDLEIRFRIYLDGEASVSLSPRRDDLPFLVMTPQWSIVSVA